MVQVTHFPGYPRLQHDAHNLLENNNAKRYEVPEVFINKVPKYMPPYILSNIIIIHKSNTQAKHGKKNKIICTACTRKKNIIVAVTNGIQTNLYKTKTVVKIVTPRCTNSTRKQRNFSGNALFQCDVANEKEMRLLDLQILFS
jgi:hypothetical protein